MSHRLSEIQRFSEIGAIIAISFFVVVGAAFSASEPQVSTEEPASDEELWEELRKLSEEQLNLSEEQLLEEVRKNLAELMAIKLQPEFEELTGEVEDALISSVGPSQAAPLVNKFKEFGTTLEDHGTTLKDLGTRFKKFEKLMLEEPERIIALPLLKNKIDTLSTQQRDLRDEVRRVYGLFKWLIGAVFTLTLSVAGMAVGLLWKLPGKHS